MMRKLKLMAVSSLLYLACSGAAYANTVMVKIDALNAMSQVEFEQTLGDIEKAPWAISEAAEKRPFTGFVDLYENIIVSIKKSDPKMQLELIRNHPELACKSVRIKEINEHSQKEQTGSGLNQCTEEEVALLQKMNMEYSKKFGFPFMLAVKGFNKEEIIQEFKVRLQNTQEQEFNSALQQVYKVVLMRLLDRVK